MFLSTLLCVFLIVYFGVHVKGKHFIINLLRYITYIKAFVRNPRHDTKACVQKAMVLNQMLELSFVDLEPKQNYKTSVL